MKKKILIGSLLVLTLLLLMPSIPAVQQKTIEDKAMNDLEDKLETITFDGVRHPLLRQFIQVSIWFKVYLGNFLWYLGTDYYGNPVDPFLCDLANLIVGRAIICFYRWQDISDTMGWNWDLEFYIELGMIS